MVDVAIGQLAEAAAATAEKAAVESEQARVAEVEAAGAAAVAIAKEETKQAEAIAQSQVEAAKATAAAMAPPPMPGLSAEEVRSIVMECLQSTGLQEWKDILDECGRHMMSLENGGDGTSQSAVVVTPDGTTPDGSAKAIGSDGKPVSNPGGEVTVIVEKPATVAAATVTADGAKPRGWFGKLILGHPR